MLNTRSYKQPNRVVSVSHMEEYDLHETDEFQPIMLALSHFIIQWNWVEHNFNVLLWHLGGDWQTGSVLSAGLGNQARSDAILALARQKESRSDILEQIEHAVSAFGKLKSNRNSLVHSHSIYKNPNDIKPHWIRSSNNPKNIHVYCMADQDDIIENIIGTKFLSERIIQLILYYISDSEQLPSFEKFQIPKVLVSIPIKILES
jgi:hypothetical protein